ncbi:hypothetical protein SAMN05444165_2766 [Paraburkholderia phenazinium]|uniref:Uncharacterized protein n=1 Tax=Paraburkholderia phenazinium TaxID=60549 RepID=A0A1N6J4F3_9BURK|nr:hypothetical protein SAMN05444165_2766 [Paraburkholderia phenazinium]
MPSLREFTDARHATQGNCKFFCGLPRDIIHEPEMHQFI